MSNTSAFILLVLSVGYACAQSGGNCESQGHVKCRTRYPSPNNFPDEKYLRDNCGSILTEYRCYVEHNKTCITPLEEMTPFAGFAAIEGVAEDFCDEDSELHRKYLEIAECLTNHEKTIVGSIRNIEQTFEEYVRESLLPERISDDAHFSKIVHCLTFTVMNAEIENVLRSNCGQDAVDIFQAIWDRLIIFGENECSVHSERIQHYYDLFNEFTPQSKLYEPILNLLK